MAEGFKVWDASGKLIIDGTKRLSRVLGVTTIGANTSGTITDAGFATGVPYWISIRDTLSPSATDNIVPPSISVSGTTLTYDNSSPRLTHRVIYGVY